MTKENWFSSETQVYWACKALIQMRVISHKTEIREVRGWRLAVIIHLLRSKYGWPIDKKSQGPDHVAYYFLPPQTDVANLNFPPSAAGLKIELAEQGNDGGAA